MEDNGIEKHCEYPYCFQNDWFCFHCNACGKNLCKIHYHHELSCPFSKIKEEPKKKVEFNYQFKYCDFCKRKIKNLKPIECDFCKGSFCLKHKLESDHDCSSLKKRFSEEKR